MPHEDPINGCRCHFLGQPALSWDPLSPRRAITPICFIALVWAELKKGAFFLPAGAPGRPDLGPQPGGSMGISGKKYVCNGLAYGPQLQPPDPPLAQAHRLLSTLFVPLFPATRLGTTLSRKTAIPGGLERNRVLNASRTCDMPSTHSTQPHFQVCHRQVPHGSSQRISWSGRGQITLHSQWL